MKRNVFLKLGTLFNTMVSITIYSILYVNTCIYIKSIYVYIDSVYAMIYLTLHHIVEVNDLFLDIFYEERKKI